MDFGLDISAKTLWTSAFVTGGYFLLITLFGLYFSKFSSSIHDFFFSGRRFAWWLPFMSMMATGIGSYSYLKYSEQGLRTGMSSALGYMNEWLILPLFFLAWLPVVYFSRVRSVPEYFERRFSARARYIAVFIFLCYIFYYIGYNLFTIGLAVQGIFGVPPAVSLPVVVCFLGAYVALGGQTAVIFTDLVQGILLYAAGFAALIYGLIALGGIEEFWAYLPLSHRNPFPPFRADPHFNSAGMFWGDALFASLAFVVVNQGFLMRFLSVRSLKEARLAGLCNVFVTLPVSALVVGSMGWIGRAIISKQEALGGPLPGFELLTIDESYHTFVLVVWHVVKESPFILALILSALLAALMSTVDTLINSAAAIGIYDIYKPVIRPKASERHYLRSARALSLAAAGLGLALAFWLFSQKGTLMAIHYKGIMMIIPSALTTLVLGVLWRRFNARGAEAALLIGFLISFLTLFFPQWIYPLRDFALGASADDPIYFRALFGVLVSAFAGIAASFLSAPPRKEKVEGLTADTVFQAMERFKRGEPNLEEGKKAAGLKLALSESLKKGEAALSIEAASIMKAREGDIVYIADSRRILGGLRSDHFRLKILPKGAEPSLALISPESIKRSPLLLDRPCFAQKII